MSISELSVRRPVTITMVYVLIVIISFVFLSRLGVALFPTTVMPIISVSTKYENVGPDEIDENVTKVLVNRLSSVSGLKKINSTSSYGSSNIRLEFDYDRDMEDALTDVQSITSSAIRSLPDNCDAPTARKFDSNSRAFMRLAVKGNLERHELKQIAEDDVQPLLERVEGVASSSVSGGAQKRIVVDLSINRLEALQIGINTISTALKDTNIQKSGGTLTQDITEYEIVVDEYYENLDEIRNTVIKTYSDGSVLKLDDVANIYEDYDSKSNKVFINGVPGLYVSVSNESDANVAKIAKSIRKTLPQINAALPQGVELEIISDDTTMIDSTMKQVYNSAISGIVLSCAIIFLFLRQIKSSIIIGLAIPISVLITLMVMSAMGLTINLMTMSGLILALGMTVDSSIVILENISLYRAKGEKSAIASILGSKGMLNAIVASTLTTLCVFIPMLLYKAELEMLGQMFYELVVTVCVAMVASLFVAVTLVPALCGSILRLDTRTQKPLKPGSLLKFIDDAIENVLVGLTHLYERTLYWVLRNRFITLVAVALSVTLSVIVFSRMGLNLQPQSSSDDVVNISITLPIGTDNDVVLETLFVWQDIINKEVGRENYKNLILSSGTSNIGNIQINLPPLEEQKLKSQDVKSKLTPYLKQFPDTNITFSAGRRMGSSSGAIDIQIKSDDTQASTLVAHELMALLKEKMPELTDVDTDLENGSPKYNLVIDKDKAASYNVSISTIASTVKTAVSGSTATVFYTGGDEYDIVVRIAEAELLSASDIMSLVVVTNAGLMSLDNFATLEVGRSPQKILREDKERINHVTANIRDGLIATKIEPQVEQCIADNIVLPDSVKLQYAGDASDVNKFGKSFIIVIILALVLVYSIMAAQFESLVDPFIIFTSIPPMLPGVVLVYKLSGAALSLYSVVGIVALVGIVVNNGIVLVDYTNSLVKQKIPVLKACVLSGTSRFRPIWMTTLTTVLGMIPMGFFPGEGGEQMQPIGMTITGGLMTAAVLTLYVAPIMYTLLNKRREKHFFDPESLDNQLLELDSRKSHE